MERVLEPELMDDPAQALAYAQADFDASNSLFIDLFESRFPDWSRTGAILDLGCGPGDIAIRLARRFAGCEVHGLDGAPSMLALARDAAALAADVAGRVEFIEGLVPGAPLPRDSYDAVVSNSLLHHLHRPMVLWESAIALAKPGAPVLIMDLARPADAAGALDIVASYAANDPEVLRTDFHNSLLAAFEPDEVRAQLAQAGLPFAVERVSDRHLAIWGRAPAP